VAAPYHLHEVNVDQVLIVLLNPERPGPQLSEWFRVVGTE